MESNETKNALVYCCNSKPKFIDMMANSINSFAVHNPSLKDKVGIYVITDVQNLDTSKVTKDINITIVDNIQYNYHSFFENRNLTTYAYFRFDIFTNPVFQDFDNLMYLDVDTEFNKPIDELFTTKHEPGIYMVREWGKR